MLSARFRGASPFVIQSPRQQIIIMVIRMADRVFFFLCPIYYRGSSSCSALANESNDKNEPVRTQRRCSRLESAGERCQLCSTSLSFCIRLAENEVPDCLANYQSSVPKHNQSNRQLTSVAQAVPVISS